MNEGAPIIIKKKKVMPHGHHGGAWKVAYADFVTAMMAFFLVMWIMGMSPDDRKQVQGYFNDPMGFMKATPKGSPNIGPTGGSRSAQRQITQGTAAKAVQKDERELKSLEKQVQASLSQGETTGDLATLIKAIEVQVTPEGLEIEFVEGKGVVFFELGSAKVRPQARQIILNVATQLRKAGRLMYIDGHTDGRPFAGGGQDNKLLSAERAESVYRLFRSGGIPEEQVLDIRGRGDRKLKYPGDPYDGRNRRVSILLPFKGGEEKVMGDVSTDRTSREQATFEAPVDIRPEKPELGAHPPAEHR